MKTVLVFDVHNIMHKNYNYRDASADIDTEVDIALSYTLNEFMFYYNKIKPDELVLGFDGDANWRVTYTKNEDIRVTDVVYKQRREKYTKREKQQRERIGETIDELRIFLQNNTKAHVLYDSVLEADDMISGICQYYEGSNTKIHIVSSDKDFIQFCRYPNVSIINPLVGGKARNLEDWNNDVGLYLFEMCIRGDLQGDGIRSSYPRLRKTKLVEAYYDDFKKTNILNHTFTDVSYDSETDTHVEKTFNTRDLFYENEILMDLTKQPKHIRDIIKYAVESEIEREKTPNFVNFLKFCRRKELNNLSSKASTFMPLFN